ncbi:hypothetical protein [Filobacillus milosensis]|uniref:hypothetical protein n=1 Tax=Filobacillus milosensis TaxID=94137 RepID=UPI00189115AC|nr:hypothetical protein [Filobacillus milosensis]
MMLFLSILLGCALAFLLLLTGPLFGGIVAFGIVAGCLFRGLYLLNSLHNKMDRLLPEPEKESNQDPLESAQAYKQYLNDKGYTE